MIIGHGPSHPLGIIIQDTPTKSDLQSNYAITGPSEYALKKFFSEVPGLNFDSFWRTCLIKDGVELPKPHKKGRKKDIETLDIIDKIVDPYKNIFNEEINDLKPFLLIPMGEISFNYLTRIQGIRKFRGSVIFSSNSALEKQIKTLPILGPDPYLNQEYWLRAITQVDIQKIPKYLNDSPPPDNLHNLWICKNAGALRVFLERQYKEDGLLVFDIETWMGIPTCLSFCFDGFESVCIPILDNTIDADNRAMMMKMVARVLESPIRKVNQNIKYDWKILERFGFHINNVVGDTMLAAACIYCEFPKNLGFLTSIYTDLPYFKDEGKEYNPEQHKRVEAYYLYNAKDSLATHQIYHKQMGEIDELGVRQVYENLVKLMPLYRRMEDRGLRIDFEVREKLRAKYQVLLSIQIGYLNALVNRKINARSTSKDIPDLVFNELGYPANARGINGTDEESIDLLCAFHHPKRGVDEQTAQNILRTISAIRKVYKVLEIIELNTYPDGRFRCEFKLGGAETGRTTAGKTTDQILFIDKNGKINKKSLGHSLQTIGKHGFVINGVSYGQDIRNMYIPSSGYSFVECDLSGAEARVDAVLAGNFNILSLFDDGIGIHKHTGAWVYNCPPEEIKKNILVEDPPGSGMWVERYYMAKTVRHAAERNMREDRLVAMTSCTRDTAVFILKAIHAKQPEIREVFHKEIIKAIQNSRLLVAPNGRRRDFFGRADHHTFNEGISFLPQAIVTDQTRFHLPKTKEDFPKVEFLVEAHDGVLAEVPIGTEEEYGSIYKRNVETPIDFRNCTLKRDYELIIPCEVGVGEDWGHIKEIKL